ncbi:MAG TPA: Rossmann-like and DUF2520 domain-containing protein [Flavobacterium sp.]|nr:Rossmann-like and DUF2520 domain-containing protein [Flavobacterium sp.]
MIKVSIIGSGNVAQHLMKAFAKSGAVDLLQVFSRKPETISDLISADKIIDDFNALSQADLYIIAVTDSAIAAVSQQLPFTGRLVVHTSGSLSADALDSKNRRGVFYPLQTFTKNKDVDFKMIPICLETENKSDYEVLEHVAKTISGNVFPIDSTQRKALHVAAVFVNNFTNHLYKIANDICTENNVPFDILKPLIAETADKVMVLSPKEAQTGPAKRNDTNTIDAHLAFLSNGNLQPIYKILTQSIIDDGKKL